MRWNLKPKYQNILLIEKRISESGTWTRFRRSRPFAIKFIRTGSRHDAIRLSGQFHLCLAQISGNHVLHRFLEELVSRTSLIIGMFGTSINIECSDAKHQKILQAIIDRAPLEARTLMGEHLKEIEISIKLPDDQKDKVDLKKLFAEM